MQIINKENIRTSISMLLKDKQLNPYEVAILINEDPANFKKYFDGKRPYPDSVLYKLTIVFGMSELDLITYPNKWIQIIGTDQSPLVAAVAEEITKDLVQYIKEKYFINSKN